MTTPAHAPIRGTQSFVTIMGEVRRRSSLTLLEIAWRWLAGALILAALRVSLGSYGSAISIDLSSLQALSAFQPVAAVHSILADVHSLWALTGPELRTLLPLAVLLWLLAAALGRTVVLRRFDANLRPRPIAVFLLTTLRMAYLGVLWAAWLWSIVWATRTAILDPAAHGNDPSVVLFCAIVIVTTLSLYVLTAVFSWPLFLAPLLAMELDLNAFRALMAAFTAGPVFSKLIEINLVLHIVKLALLVLAMVFSATPLPFSTVTSQTFLNYWWSGVALLWFAASDYFQVVRCAAYLSLYRAYHPQAADLH